MLRRPRRRPVRDRHAAGHRGETLAATNREAPLLHLGSAVLLAITIIGLPLAVANAKLVPAALWPFGREIVRSADVSAALAAYRAQQAEARAQQELERPIPPPVELPKAAERPPELAPRERKET